ncbi:hypothetical protein JAAARDRAFT_36314 [Jaapia argillacea MUCL 33604]|uniref:FAD dependent oxidoreductase domain-containing protein n=1 Tax=Jaapia argillacea MUCL 33604 TaxID=933084 RepID=A0A067PSP0_9AGAM|nr:hypothetical protein JAAARDRAFT_36314 [Jaapia argillacea MUCL 33604]
MSKPYEKNIVIIGGGIIGCTAAYYLSHHPSYSPSTTSITLLEASKRGAAQGASGKAGGLVAKWAYPRELVDVSFTEHVRLASEHNGTDRWGWRFVGCGSWEGRGEVTNDEGSKSGVGKGGARKSLEKTLGLDGGKSTKSARKAKGLPDDLTWVSEDLTASYSPMAPAGDTAQVHPYLFTTSMLELAQSKGVTFTSGRATSIEREGGCVTSVSYTDVETGEVGKTIRASHVILAAGAWSPSLLPTLPISATRAHSITIHPASGVTIAPYVLFTEIALSQSNSKRTTTVSPEIYARPTNEVYACGPGDSSKLPMTVDDVVVDEEACESIRQHVASISKELKEGAVDKHQACFLPVASIGGGPIVGEATKIAKGLIVATGHTCWGICNAPGTAKAISELVMDGKIGCVNLKKLDPARYLP